MGILRRSAEGHIKHLFAVLGAMLVAGLWVPIYGYQVGEGWIYNGEEIFLPEKFGWAGAVLITLVILIGFYIFVTLIEKKAKRNLKN